jgi:hypothetical protein
MTKDSKIVNPFPNLFGVYTKEVEKMQPLVKQGINDVFAVYQKMWTAITHLQKEAIIKGSGNYSTASYIENAKVVGDKMIQLQKETSQAIADLSFRNWLTMIDASKKFNF